MPESNPRSSHFILQHHKTLLIDRNSKPIGCPVQTVNARRSLQLMEQEEIEVVALSPSTLRDNNGNEIQLPSILKFNEVRQDIGMNVPARCNSENLYIRDMGRCQYTGVPLFWNHPDPHQCATMDHVTPVSFGGQTVWDNVVLASAYINSVVKKEKNLRYANLTLRRMPYEPTLADLQCLEALMKRLYREHMPPEWRPYFNKIGTTLRVRLILQGKLYQPVVPKRAFSPTQIYKTKFNFMQVAPTQQVPAFA